MRVLLAAFAALVVSAPVSAGAGGFRTYPGFLDPEGVVEMVHDKGLMLELHVRCSRKPNGQIRAGIMSYSKVEQLFCSSRHRCFRSPVRAVRDTCGG